MNKASHRHDKKKNRNQRSSVFIQNMRLLIPVNDTEYHFYSSRNTGHFAKTCKQIFMNQISSKLSGYKNKDDTCVLAIPIHIRK